MPTSKDGVCGSGKGGNSSDLGMPINFFVIINVSKYFLPLSNGYQLSIV